MKDSENIDLDYEILLLNHLNRISELSTRIMGFSVATSDRGVPDTHYKETDKVDAFHWAVRVLASLIPVELKDKKYKEDQKDLDKKLEGWRKKKAEYKKAQPNYDVEWLGNLVNLLNRKGYLTESKTVGAVIKKRK